MPSRKIPAFFSDRFVLFNFFAAITLNALIWGLFLWKVHPSPDPIPLHYNVFFGPDLVGSWQEAYYLPGIAFLFFVFNFFLASVLLEREKGLGYLLVGFTTIQQVFVGIGGIALILINIS